MARIVKEVFRSGSFLISLADQQQHSQATNQSRFHRSPLIFAEMV